MEPNGGEDVARPRMSSNAKRGSEDEGVMGTASLEVFCAAAEVHAGPTLYDVVYTRGGWIWRTSHRYRDWLALKERLRADYGARNLPDEKVFPQKEDVGAIVTKLLTSCQGCREGGVRPVGILEERRKGLQAYFSTVLEERRELWDASADVKAFFFPGPPTSYSAALSRRRSEQLKEEKLKAKEAASAASAMASSLKSTLGSLFESTPSDAASSKTGPSSSRPSSFRSSTTAATSSARSASTSASSSSSSSVFSPRRSREDQQGSSAAGAGGMMHRLSSMKKQMPSLQDLLFDATAAAAAAAGPGSRTSSRHGGGKGGAAGGSVSGSSRHSRVPSSTHRPPSESGVTDPDGGISEAGGSSHSSTFRE